MQQKVSPLRYAEAMQTSPQSEQENEQQVIAATRAWLQAMVIDLNLCPFARRPLLENKVRFSVSTATEEADLLAAYPDTGEIPERNIEKMRQMGIEQLRTILSNCSG